MGQNQEIFLIGLLGSFSVGIFIGSKLSAVDLSGLALFVLIVYLTSIIKRQARVAVISCMLLFFMLGMFRIQANEIIDSNDIARFAGEEVIVEGHLTVAPNYRLTPNESEVVVYTLETNTVKTKDTTLAVHGGLRITVTKPNLTQTEAQVRDVVKAAGFIRKPTNFNNPGQIDLVRQLKNDGITALMYTSSTQIEIKPTQTTDLWVVFLRSTEKIRQHYRSLMRNVMPTTDAAAIFALMFGGYEGIKPQLIEAFQRTGMIHILSVSGSHISMLAMIVAIICKSLAIKNNLQFVIGASIILSYAVIVGGSPPVIRSTIMGLLTFLALSLNKSKDSRRLLTLTTFFMLLHSPLLLYNISFQLSVSSTSGIIFLSPILKRFALIFYRSVQIKLLLKPNYFRVIFTTTATTLGATLMSAPIVAWYFNQISLSSILTNILLVPILEIIIVTGLLTGILSVVFQQVGEIIFLTLSLILGFIYEIANKISSSPLNIVHVATSNIMMILVYYIILLDIIILPKHHRIAKFSMILLIVIATISSAIEYKKTELQIHFIDVHQGDCALLITPRGMGVLFDSGGTRNHAFDIGERVVLPYLRHYGIEELEGLFLTHAHEDHSEGAGSILKRMKVKQIITSSADRVEYAEVFGVAESSPLLAVMRPAREGEIFHIDGVTIEALYVPPRVLSSKSTNNETNNVYRISYGNISFLITGDLTKEGEKLLIEKNVNLSSTVLKVSHHGSPTSSSLEFLQEVGARYAVISVGANNGFGHPNRKVLERLESTGTRILRTDENGAVSFYTDGTNLSIATAK